MENTLIGVVGFEDVKSAHHFIESNTLLQAGAAGFTAPPRAPTADKDALSWSSPVSRNEAVSSILIRTSNFSFEKIIF